MAWTGGAFEIKGLGALGRRGVDLTILNPKLRDALNRKQGPETHMSYTQHCLHD